MYRKNSLQSVYFCMNCDDQPPWKADRVYDCPTCRSADSVETAKRFTNMDEQNNCQAKDY